MNDHAYFLDLAAVVIGAAVLSWLSFLARQPIILAYLVAGMILGPYGLKAVQHLPFIDTVSEMGITLLLFLAGIELTPRRLGQLMKQYFLPTVASCLVFFALAWGIGRLAGLAGPDCIILGLAMMFSSTILVLKLLPTVALHQKRMGALSIAILIAQDLLAVSVLIYLSSSVGIPTDPSAAATTAAVASTAATAAAETASTSTFLLWLPLKGALLVAGALLLEQYLLRPIMRQIERFHETLYLLTLAWCLIGAIAATQLGLSMEVGAFIAGVALSRNPIAYFLFEGLKSFRDFFIVFFFFALGARLDPQSMPSILLPALGLAVILIATKGLVFYAICRRVGEERGFSIETASRLAQCSEFSLLIAAYAEATGRIQPSTALLIVVTTLATMVLSSYLVTFRFPSPLGRGDLKQD